MTSATRSRTRGSAAASSAGPLPTLTATAIAGRSAAATAAITGVTSSGRNRPRVRPGMVGSVTSNPARAKSRAARRARGSSLPSAAAPWPGHEADLPQQRGHREIRLPAEAGTDRRHHVLEEARVTALAAEVIQDDDDAARLHHTAHLPERGDGIRYRGDRIGRERSIELVVAEVHRRRIHDLQRHVGHRERLDALDRL